jgi:hypothetical protein
MHVLCVRGEPLIHIWNLNLKVVYYTPLVRSRCRCEMDQHFQVLVACIDHSVILVFVCVALGFALMVLIKRSLLLVSIGDVDAFVATNLQGIVLEPHSCSSFFLKCANKLHTYHYIMKKLGFKIGQYKLPEGRNYKSTTHPCCNTT